MQSHDITRQQVEHVIEALQDVQREAPRRALTPQAAVLLQVQRAQLGSATGSFCHSVEKIDSDLQSVARRVEQMSPATLAEAVNSDEKEDRFSFFEMRQRMAEVLGKICDLSSSRRAVRTTVVDVQQVSRELREAVKEMHGIELQLSRISVNGIASSEIGNSGEPLGVVAEAMQTLQIECTNRSRAATNEIESIDRIVDSLGTEEQFVAGSDEETVLANLQASNKNLDEATMASTAQSRTIADLAGSLKTELQQLRRHTDIAKIFAETSSRCATCWFIKRCKTDRLLSVVTRVLG